MFLYVRDVADKTQHRGLICCMWHYVCTKCVCVRFLFLLLFGGYGGCVCVCVCYLVCVCLCVCEGEQELSRVSQILASRSVQSRTPAPPRCSELPPAAWVYRGDDP